MLEHAHSWSFDPTRKIVISVANAVFREIRLKYGYSKDDELGSKPNDWLRDGLNNVNYTILAREHRKEWLYLRTDVSMIRATNISITLNGTNRLNLVQDYETNRLTGILPCEFKKNIQVTYRKVALLQIRPLLKKPWEFAQSILSAMRFRTMKTRMTFFIFIANR